MRASPAAQLPRSRRLLIFSVMAAGQFMALIDIQIVAASLNDLQAGLSAGPDEISWVQTAYLMAELIMIPLSGFLAQALSTRGLFALAAGLFTAASALCGLAWNIESMVLFRALQGFVGGAMIPTAFATGFALFEGKDRAMIPAVLGIVSVLAPTLGPTVGGWITDAASWHWIFYINIAPGVAVTVATIMLMRDLDQPDLSMLGRIDWLQLTSMAVFLAGLEFILEEGQRHDWFGDPLIRVAAWVSLVAFILFLERCLRSETPVVTLAPFRSPTFAFACVFNLVLGFGLYASTYLTPVFLGMVRGLSSSQIGTIVFVVGISQFVGTFVAAKLSQRIDLRLMITPGLLAFAASLWMMSYVTVDWGFRELLAPQLLRGFAVMIAIVPSVNMALSGFQAAQLRQASGLFNLMRNLGGAIGIALSNVWLYDATQLARSRYGEALGEPNRSVDDVVADWAAQIALTTGDPARAGETANARFASLLEQQALAIGFDEVFRTMAWMFLLALILVPFCRSQRTGNDIRK